MLAILRSTLAAALLAALTACGGDGPTDNSGGASRSVTATGDGQTARIGSAVGTAVGVIVRDADGQPAAGVAVRFAVTAGGGQVERATATTDAGGVATAGVWTLGVAPGPNTITATVGSGAAARTATITATARLPRWTVMVYLAADNTLALAGLDDIDEMELVPASPEVQVVVQGELGAEQLRLAGLSAAQVNLPNFNTFRYRVRPGAVRRLGPDGAVTDIGNRAMTDPAQLREFVTWARATYPAERHALVLWNHGGGFQGLIEDLTSSGGRMMSIAELPAALQGTGTLDLLDFDMGLMGGYETLETVKALARVVTFSQDAAPAAGNPYAPILAGLTRDPSLDERALGALIVEHYHQSFFLTRTSTTKSAFDLSGYPAFAQSLGGLAAALQANIGALGGELAAAIAASQKFETPYFTDLANFLDTLRTRTTDATLLAAIDATRAQALSPSFRVATRVRNGTNAGASDLQRATGLHVVLPSGQARDRLAASGPGSFAAYQQLYAGRPWTTFLAAWVPALPALGTVDQGEGTRFELYLTWSAPGLVEPADLDLAVVEPSGKVYIPYLGTVTPNGHFTADMYAGEPGYEGYFTNRFVEPGPYYFFAMLWTDPSNARPEVDVQYRYAQRAPLVSLYAPTLPRVSLATSWLDDETFTWAEVFEGAYTDFRWMSYMEFGQPTLTAARAPGALPAPALPSAHRAAPPPRLTDAQLRTVREMVRARRRQ